METRNAPPSHHEHAAHRDNANHMHEEVDHRGTRGDQQGFDHQDMAAATPMVTLATTSMSGTA